MDTSLRSMEVDKPVALWSPLSKVLCLRNGETRNQQRVIGCSPRVEKQDSLKDAALLLKKLDAPEHDASKEAVSGARRASSAARRLGRNLHQPWAIFDGTTAEKRTLWSCWRFDAHAFFRPTELIVFISPYQPPTLPITTDTRRANVLQARPGLTHLEKVSSAGRKAEYALLAGCTSENKTPETKPARAEVKNFTGKFAETFSRFENPKKTATAPDQPRQAERPRSRQVSAAISKKCAYFEPLSEKPNSYRSTPLLESIV